MKREKWKAIPDFSAYQASSQGRVRSRYTDTGCKRKLGKGWRVLKPSPDYGGYLLVTLYRDKKPHTCKVHHLILQTFIGPCPVGFQACHNNGISYDNRLENLRWDTPRSNHDDTIKHGSKRGIHNGRARLTPHDVRKIRKLYKSGETIAALARTFDMSESAIRFIIQRKNWSHVE